MWERVKEVAASNPAKLAVIEGEKFISYGALWHDALRQAEAMRRAGLDRRDVVLVQLPNWHEFVTLAVAAEKASCMSATSRWCGRARSRDR